MSPTDPERWLLPDCGPGRGVEAVEGDSDPFSGTAKTLRQEALGQRTFCPRRVSCTWYSDRQYGHKAVICTMESRVTVKSLESLSYAIFDRGGTFFRNCEKGIMAGGKIRSARKRLG
jgi:hypothetical protein